MTMSVCKGVSLVPYIHISTTFNTHPEAESLDRGYFFFFWHFKNLLSSSSPKARGFISCFGFSVPIYKAKRKNGTKACTMQVPSPSKGEGKGWGMAGKGAGRHGAVGVGAEGRQGGKGKGKGKGLAGQAGRVVETSPGRNMQARHATKRWSPHHHHHATQRDDSSRIRGHHQVPARTPDSGSSCKTGVPLGTQQALRDRVWVLKKKERPPEEKKIVAEQLHPYWRAGIASRKREPGQQYNNTHNTQHHTTTNNNNV